MVLVEMVHRLSVFGGVERSILHRALGILAEMDSGTNRDIDIHAFVSQQPTRVAFNLIHATRQG